VLIGPNIRLLNIANPMYMQKLNLNEMEAISQKLYQKFAYTAMAG
jgi:hypothetical protein